MEIRDQMWDLAGRSLSIDEKDTANRAVGNIYNHSQQTLNYTTVTGLLMLADELEKVEERIHTEIASALKDVSSASIEHSNLSGLPELLDQKAAFHRKLAAELANAREQRRINERQRRR